LAPPAHDALVALAQAHGLPAEVPVVSGSTTGFRLRARLAIRGRRNTPKIGLFELGTHRVVHIPNCSVQHPLINRVAGVVRRALVDAGISCYSEKATVGLARYLQVVVERSSQSAQVVLVANSDTPEPLEGLFALLRERLGTDLHSLWFNANVGRSNTILGPVFHGVHGPASVVEHFGGGAIHYPPGAFGQNNLDVAETLIAHLRGEVPRGARVAEFYAGVGAIGLSLVDQVGEIRMNEVGEASLAGLALGLAELDAATRAKVGVVPGPAGARCAAAAGVDAVIADPPRRGLDPELLEFLCKVPPERFVYVSCGLESLLADAARLTAGGTLRLRRLTAFNLMPFTEHVETVACFERA
jgi:tRNA/tmRNA/rRNA uracil-C5-methylase (TrmA/RlmC/RlmD family)